MTPAPKSRRICIYLRVSTDGQSTDNQERELRAIADKAGWEVVQVYSDKGVSGAKERDQRPAFDAMLRDATQRRFDLIAAWSVDRLGRSLQDLVAFLADIHAVGCNLYLHQQALDTTTPAGKALFQMLGVFAEFERAMIVARVNAGLARAKAQGKRLGRPRIDVLKERAVCRDLAKGDIGIRKIAQKNGVGVSVVQRLKASGTGSRESPSEGTGITFRGQPPPRSVTSAR